MTDLKLSASGGPQSSSNAAGTRHLTQLLYAHEVPLVTTPLTTSARPHADTVFYFMLFILPILASDFRRDVRLTRPLHVMYHTDDLL